MTATGIYSLQRTAFSTSVVTASGIDDLRRVWSPIEAWLQQKAAAFGLELVENGALLHGENERAGIMARCGDESSDFAFRHSDEQIAALTWHVLGSCRREDGHIRIDIDVSAEGGPLLTPPLGVPSFMTALIQQVGLVDDGHALTDTAVQISRHEAPEFVRLLKSNTRTLPIVAFSEPLPMSVGEVLRIAKRVAGAAHLAVVETSGSFVISDMIGKEFSVFQGAARVYTPTVPSDPKLTRLYFPATIERYNTVGRANGPFGILRFADIIVRATLDRRMWPVQPSLSAGLSDDKPSAATAVLPPPAPTRKIAKTILDPASAADISAPASLENEQVAELNNVIAELRGQLEIIAAERDRAKLEAENNLLDWENTQTELDRIQAIDDISIGGATDHENEIFRAVGHLPTVLRSLIDRTMAGEARADQLQLELDDSRRTTMNLRARVETLQQREPETPEIPQPSDYHDVETLIDYLTSRHGTKILIHPNARKTLRSGIYSDNHHLVEALDLLGTIHHDMKTGANGEAHDTFTAECERLRLKYSPALSAVGSGQVGSRYTVMWDGRKIGSDEIWHLRNLGTSYAPERMAAVYFFWDDARKATVVTSGPAKLDTTADRT